MSKEQSNTGGDPSATVTHHTGPIFPTPTHPHPHPCPTCGTCPTCGRGPWYPHYPYYPWYPPYTITSGTGSITYTT